MIPPYRCQPRHSGSDAGGALIALATGCQPSVTPLGPGRVSLYHGARRRPRLAGLTPCGRGAPSFRCRSHRSAPSVIHFFTIQAERVGRLASDLLPSPSASLSTRSLPPIARRAPQGAQPQRALLLTRSLIAARLYPPRARSPIGGRAISCPGFDLSPRRAIALLHLCCLGCRGCSSRPPPGPTPEHQPHESRQSWRTATAQRAAGQTPAEGKHSRGGPSSLFLLYYKA